MNSVDELRAKGLSDRDIAAPDIFGEVEAALPEGWYITLLERFESDEGVWWGAAAEKVEDEMSVVEADGQGDTPALALRDLVRRVNA